MSKESELITKVTAMLDQPNDWEPWYQIIRDKALVKKVWMYCDISKEKEGLPRLEEPTKPIAASINPTATAISDLSSTEQSYWLKNYQTGDQRKSYSERKSMRWAN